MRDLRLREERAMELLAAHGAALAWRGTGAERGGGGGDGSAEKNGEGVERGPDVEGSLLVGLDPASHKVLLLLKKGNVEDWGSLLEARPREVAREYLEPGEAASGFVGRELARRAGFPGQDQTRLERLVAAAHEALSAHEALWVDVRFCRSGEGFAVCRAVVEVCDEALFRHPELEGAGEPSALPGMTERERRAREAGILYLDLDGDIGLLPGGMGFALAALDIVRRVGGSPANIMDSGGEVTKERLETMMNLLLDNPAVVTAFCSRWAGLTRAEDWARLMIDYIIEKKPCKPIVLRVAGNGEAEARRLFEEAAEKHPEEFKRVWVFYSNTPFDNVAREAVALTDMIKRGESPFGEERAAEEPTVEDGPRESSRAGRASAEGKSPEGDVAERGRRDNSDEKAPGGSKGSGSGANSRAEGGDRRDDGRSVTGGIGVVNLAL
ncbi:MAG: hypothetical protein QXW06_06995, partial [Thermoplasmata archaeon]